MKRLLSTIFIILIYNTDALASQESIEESELILQTMPLKIRADFDGTSPDLDNYPYVYYGRSHQDNELIEGGYDEENKYYVRSTWFLEEQRAKFLSYYSICNDTFTLCKRLITRPISDIFKDLESKLRAASLSYQQNRIRNDIRQYQLDDTVKFKRILKYRYIKDIEEFANNLFGANKTYQIILNEAGVYFSSYEENSEESGTSDDPLPSKVKSNAHNGSSPDIEIYPYVYYGKSQDFEELRKGGVKTGAKYYVSVDFYKKLGRKIRQYYDFCCHVSSLISSLEKNYSYSFAEIFSQLNKSLRSIADEYSPSKVSTVSPQHELDDLVRFKRILKHRYYKDIIEFASLLVISTDGFQTILDTIAALTAPLPSNNDNQEDNEQTEADSSSENSNHDISNDEEVIEETPTFNSDSDL